MEQRLTRKEAQSWPEDLKADIEAGTRAFDAFVCTAASKLAEQGLQDIRAKVKAVADLIWSKLTSGFSKDVQHVQHISTFTGILAAPRSTKRQLDCAGVVTTALAACWRLASAHGHADLAACRLQVSEDHCWLNLDPDGEREGSVEVTTDAAAKRGQPVSEQAWRGWLYTGGRAVLCSPKMTLAALLASVNPSIVARQTTGTDSAELQYVQRTLLALVRARCPPAVYPAALCALADLVEICGQDELQLASTAEELAGLLERRSGDAQELFEKAVQSSLRPEFGSGRCWYPHSYLIGFLARRARFLLEDAIPIMGEAKARAIGDPLLHTALDCCGAGKAAAVLRHYRFLPVDEELHKDVEGVLEIAVDILKYLHAREGGAAPLADPVPLARLLELWDGICCCWAGRPKPAAWTAALLRAARWFAPGTRAAAAASAEVKSHVMLRAKPMLEALKPAQLRALFEVSDTEGDSQRQSKRIKRQ